MIADEEGCDKTSETRPSRWPFDRYECTPTFLSRNGLLSDEEANLIRLADSEYNQHRAYPFRRRWSWWKFTSPAPRDFDEPEAFQLQRLDVLTDREQAILADPAQRYGPSQKVTIWDSGRDICPRQNKNSYQAVTRRYSRTRHSRDKPQRFCVAWLAAILMLVIAAMWFATWPGDKEPTA